MQFWGSATVCATNTELLMNTVTEVQHAIVTALAVTVNLYDNVTHVCTCAWRAWLKSCMLNQIECMHCQVHLYPACKLSWAENWRSTCMYKCMALQPIIIARKLHALLWSCMLRHVHASTMSLSHTCQSWSTLYMGYVNKCALASHATHGTCVFNYACVCV